MSDNNDNIRRIHWQDQLDAASERAEEISHELGAIMKSMNPESHEARPVYKTFSDTYLGSKFTWMRSYEDYKSSDLKHCGHVDMSAPDIWFVTFWNPFILFCAQCVGPYLTSESMKADDVCDYCKTSGLIIFHETNIQTGPFMVFGNICTECHNKQEQDVA